jgi:hypothetical protein
MAELMAQLLMASEEGLSVQPQKYLTEREGDL